MPAGRPTKLNQELLDKAKTYLATCVDTVDFTDKGHMNFVNVELPTIVGLALYLGINKDTVNEWCKPIEEDIAEYEPYDENGVVLNRRCDLFYLRQEFSVLVKEIVQEQEKRLLNKGLGGLYNPKISALVLGRYGYTEKTETDITTKGDKISTGSSDIEEIAKRVGEELKKKNE